jgi:hypothetical protein
MQPTRFVLAAGAVGVAAIVCACGTLLGVDDVGYAGSPDAAVDSAAVDATVDAAGEAGGDAADGGAKDAAFEAADGDAGQVAFTCDGSAALLCADFEGPDPTAAYLRGVPGSGVLVVDSTGLTPTRAADRTGLALKLDVPALANASEAGHCIMQFPSTVVGATHLHLEMDAKMSIAPSEEPGSANIFALQFPSLSSSGCVFAYAYATKQAFMNVFCNGTLVGFPGFPGPFAGDWTHLTMDIALNAGTFAFAFANGKGGVDGGQDAGGTLDHVILLLGGEDKQGPAPAKGLLIDNVVMRFE